MKLPTLTSESPRTPDITIDFEGQSIPAVSGEPVAVALVAAGARALSRSIKYHRPRNAFCFAGHCGACLMNIDGEPNVKSCLAPCHTGQHVERQNAFPSASMDMLAAADFLFPKGMDHHTMFTAPRAVNLVLQKVVRELGGLGRLPAEVPPALPTGERRQVDVVVVGAGPAGLGAATAVRRARPAATVLVIDEGPAPGGSLLSWPGGGPAQAQARVAEARGQGVQLWPRATAFAWYPEDSGGLLAVDRSGTLVGVQARRYVYATGTYDVNMLFGNNDRPGVLAARAVGRLLVHHGVLAGKRPIVVGRGEYVDALTEALKQAGARAVAVDPTTTEVVAAHGASWVRKLEVKAQGSTTSLGCDLVAVAQTPAPASELPRQHGAQVLLDAARGGFACICQDDGQVAAGVYVCGDVTGYLGVAAAAQDGERVGAAVAASW